MKYAQIQQLAKALRNQGVIDKKFNLGQKAEILIAEIQKNITKVDRTNISKELAAILLDFTIFAINYKSEATKTPQKTTKKAAKSTKKTETEEQEMTQEVFNHEFIQVYAKEQIRQELEGVVAMRAEELRELFQEKHEISNEAFYKFFYKVPNMFTTLENNKILCQVFFKRQKDGTYTLAA